MALILGGPPLDLGFPNYVLIRICDASSATIYKELFECVISKYRIEEEVEKVLALASHALPWPNYFAGGCKNYINPSASCENFASPAK